MKNGNGDTRVELVKMVLELGEAESEVAKGYLAGMITAQNIKKAQEAKEKADTPAEKED